MLVQSSGATQGSQASASSPQGALHHLDPLLANQRMPNLGQPLGAASLQHQGLLLAPSMSSTPQDGPGEEGVVGWSAR